MIPTEIYSSTFNVNEWGGFGTEADGDKLVSKSISYLTGFNGCGLISSITNTRTFEYSKWKDGNTGALSVGDELIDLCTTTKNKYLDDYPYLGMYVFRRIAKIDGTTIILNRKITKAVDGFEFSDSLLEEYYVQIIKVPNYRIFTLNNGKTITPFTEI